MDYNRIFGEKPADSIHARKVCRCLQLLDAVVRPAMVFGLEHVDLVLKKWDASMAGPAL